MVIFEQFNRKHLEIVFQKLFFLEKIKSFCEAKRKFSRDLENHTKKVSLKNPSRIFPVESSRLHGTLCTLLETSNAEKGRKN
jgi:hypothetical protein